MIADLGKIDISEIREFGSDPISAPVFHQQLQTIPTFDVRSPAEFQKGHVPGAISLPLFSDSERAKVGKSYHESGQDKAIAYGIDLVRPKVASMIESVVNASSQLKHEPRRANFYCWRGGLRSRSVAWLLKSQGFEVSVMQGGYKSFRKSVLDFFSFPFQLTVLSGLTGAGKTKVLHELSELGEQVVDLESLANHRGSVFGGIGQSSQPSVEHFENLLFDRLSGFDANRNIWVEDEGRCIGNARLPNAFYDQIKSSNAWFLERSIESRAKILLEEYGKLPIGQIEAAILKISSRLGGLRTRTAIENLHLGKLLDCTIDILTYYDRAYLKSKKKIKRAQTISVLADGKSSKELAEEIRADAKPFPGTTEN